MNARARNVLLFALALLVSLSSGTLVAGVGEWTTSGPEGAVVENLAADPSNPSIVYAATFRQLYKSADAGTTWAPTGLAGGATVILPTSDPSVVYAMSSWFFPTIHRSTDGGGTWVGLEGPPHGVFAIAVAPDDPASLYAATDSGLLRSADAGNSWQRLTSPTPAVGAVIAVAVDSIDSRTIYAGLDAGSLSGVYRSDDRGATWRQTAFHGAVRALVAQRAPERRFGDGDRSLLYALTRTGLLVTEGGSEWRQLGSLFEPTDLAIDPNDPRRLYAIANGIVYSSSDEGATMTAVSGGNFGAGVRAIATVASAEAGSGVLVGSSRGVSRSEDGGRHWSPANRGIRGLFVQSVAVDPIDPKVVFATGAAGLYESHDGGETWNDPVPGSPDPDVVAIDPSDRSTLYAGGPRGIHKSTDGGRTWSVRSSNIAYEIYDLVIDPHNPRRIFAGTFDLYRSGNGAESWESILKPDEQYSSYYYYPAPIDTVAIAPSDGSTIYAAGSSDAFAYRSDDGGDHWSDLHVGFVVHDLEVDSCDPRIVLAGSWDSVHRSLDGGETWSASRSPGNSIWALARDPRRSSSFFAGTSAGLFWTNDRGATWKRFEPALHEPVRAVSLDPSGRFLYAGTEHGVYTLERTFGPCAGGPDRLCLIGGKYQVSVIVQQPGTGHRLPARAIAEGDGFGYFSFPAITGDPEFPEVFVKMVDATGAPAPYGGHAWVFHSSLTDLSYTVTVLETDTGRVRTYDASDNEPLTCGRADTSAFDRACEEAAGNASSPLPGTRLAASGLELSLLGGRFRATLTATDPRSRRTVPGTALAKADGFGYFSLPGFTGDPTYPEVFVKMTDGTSAPGGRFWVFHTGLTDLEYTLTVTDGVTGAVRTYRRGSPVGTELCGQADTSAFPG